MFFFRYLIDVEGWDPETAIQGMCIGRTKAHVRLYFTITKNSQILQFYFSIFSVISCAGLYRRFCLTVDSIPGRT